MQNFRKIIRPLVVGLLSMYVGLVLMLHAPFVQKGLGRWAASALSEKLQTEVGVSNVDLGFLNCIVVSDLSVYDRQGRVWLKAARAAATFDVLKLFAGSVEITTVQLFGLQLQLMRDTPDTSLNCQFAIDALSTNNTETTPSALDLRINSIIVRRAAVSYDVLSIEKPDEQFSPSHMKLEDFALTVSIKSLTNDSARIVVKRLNFTEQNTGFRLENLQTAFSVNRQAARIDSLHLRTANSHIDFGLCEWLLPNPKKREAANPFPWKRIDVQLNPSQITPADFACFLPEAAEWGTPLYIETQIAANEDDIEVGSLRIESSDRSIVLDSNISAAHVQSAAPYIRADIRQFSLMPTALDWLTSHMALPDPTARMLARTGGIHVEGHAESTLPLRTDKERGSQRADDKLRAELRIDTDAGSLLLDGEMDESQHISGHVETTEPLQVGRIAENKALGDTEFQLDIEAQLADKQLAGSVKGEVGRFDYNGYTYHDIRIDGQATGESYEGLLNIDDDNLYLDFNGKIDLANTQAHTVANLTVRQFNPHALHLTDRYAHETFSFRAKASTWGNDFRSATGTIRLDSLTINTPDEHISLRSLEINAERLENERMHIDVDGDFVSARFDGNVSLLDLVPSFQNQLAQHLPAFLPSSQASVTPNAKFDFNIELSESALLHHFVEADFSLPKPIRIGGSLKSQILYSFVQLDAPRLTYNGTNYDDVKMYLNGSRNFYDVVASFLRREETTSTRFDISAQAFNNRLNTQLRWNRPSETPSSGRISASTDFRRGIGDQLQAHIQLQPSEVSFNDTTWQLSTASIDIEGKNISCHDLNLHRDNRFLSVNGRISESPDDSLLVRLNDIEVGYVLDLVDFTAVHFKGRASGQAQVGNIYQKPLFAANLRVEDFSLGSGRIGTGLLHANWDNTVNGIRVDGHIFDTDAQQRDRMTDVHGYISPADNDIQLRIDANNTDVAFLNDFLGSVFDDIRGSASGTLNVVGPMSEINLVGDMNADIDMRLHATNVPYHIRRADTLHFRPYRFRFDDISIYDDHGNHGIVNGYVSHRNVKNFGYHFNIDMQNLQAYEEKQFNSDKFMGNVFANGTLTLHGADHHPLNIDADVTPTRGSFFAYDVATPDAIANTSFITFKDRATTSADDATATSADDAYDYSGDIFMNINIHLTPDCEIKLRMDNADDGYISTFGSGNLQASYHNKGAFTLNGTYNIQSGRYRLYLQDIIYRDLALQNGSNVVFNGNPFDANIHLICWHTLNAVPLIDLTANSAYNSNSKVKVICVLDITGKLGNMNFNFDLNLPNVNDETRQLVRSLISTEEEMNMQMIYLLGLGRFYTNEYARATGESSSSGAVNTLLSSTISGQINQMLSNVIGTDSKWNFGTGLSTGERGWNDLDIEGILSGRLLDDRLLINGNFGYRDNALTQQGSFIGDFDVKWRIRPNGTTYLKAYNQTNDRYFTKATLNTQGIGISFQRDFESWRQLFRRTMNQISDTSASDEGPSTTK